MINSKKILLGLLASSLSFNAFPMEQSTPEIEVTQEEVVAEAAPTATANFRIQTINFLQKKLEHIKKCLQGKETCSKTDFAILGTTLLALYGFIQAVSVRIETLATSGYYKQGLLYHPISKTVEVPERVGIAVGKAVAKPLEPIKEWLRRKKAQK